MIFTLREFDIIKLRPNFIHPDLPQTCQKKLTMNLLKKITMLISDNYVCNNNNKLLHVSVTFIAYSVYRSDKKERQ